MAEITLNAYPVSEMQQKKLKEKYRAFSSADCSKRAEKEGAFKSESYGTGWYYTRSAFAGSSSFVYYVRHGGDLYRSCSSNVNTGVRVALQTIYNPNNSIAKGCRSVKRTAEIWDEQKQKAEKVTNEAPVVTFGKKEYIWLNKEECEAGTASTMELVSLELVAKSVPFDKNGDTNDFAQATEMHKQYLEIATEDCTKEELDMIVAVKMSEKDNYNSTTPIFKSKEQQEWQDKLRKNPNEFLNIPSQLFKEEYYINECLDIAKASIKQETMNLSEVSDEYVQNVTEQLKLFSEKIEKEKNTIKQQDEKSEKSNNNRTDVLAMLDGKGEGK